MIIEINATVCARGDMTMVSRRQFMIVYSKHGRRVQSS
jgi:hypothetical protein